MKKEIADRWIAALRDPEARQCTGALERISGSQCCLGVLCRVMGVKGVAVIDKDWLLSFDGKTTELPRSVMNKAGIGTHMGWIAPLKKHLADFNDSGKTFPEIADIIEEHWESL